MHSHNERRTILTLTIILARESVSSVWDEALPLISKNHQESGSLDQIEFAPKVEVYDALEKAGVLKTFTARDGVILVGYAVFLISPTHLHYPATSWAVQDVMYVDRDHRGSMPLRFLAYQDISLRDVDGIDLVYRHNTLHKDYARLLLHMGYRAEEVRYFKDLRDAK